MNKDEKVVKGFLEPKYTLVEHEPDGKVPPDFAIDETIGVEVRRLNQQHRAGGKSTGLEELSIPLIKTINNELSRYKTKNKGNGYFIAACFSGIPDKKKIVKEGIQKAINDFESQNEKIPFFYNVGNNLTLEFFYISNKTAQKYRLGIESDLGFGGWIIPLYVTEISFCIEEKMKKINPYLNKYKSWWLILVDHICCIKESDVLNISEQISKPSCFERIIILDTNGKDWLEI